MTTLKPAPARKPRKPKKTKTRAGYMLVGLGAPKHPRVRGITTVGNGAVLGGLTTARIDGKVPPADGLYRAKVTDTDKWPLRWHAGQRVKDGILAEVARLEKKRKPKKKTITQRDIAKAREARALADALRVAMQ